MGRKDIITKEYMEDTVVFADVFNHMIYQGEKVIDPKNLKELDTASVVIPYGADGAEVPYQKYRDVFKILCAMEDENAVYLLLGVENQSNVHYAMPVKNMVYDSLEYAAQVQKAKSPTERHCGRRIQRRRNRIRQSSFQAFTRKTDCSQS